MNRKEAKILAKAGQLKSVPRRAAPAAARVQSDGVEVSSEVITPERAAEILGNRDRNRSIKMSKVRTFAGDMARGEWLDNGQTISISMEGKLLDGQHRLMAVIDANIPVRFLVARYVSPLTFHTIDSGSARSFSDVLHIMGEQESKSLAAAVRTLYFYRSSNGKNLYAGGTGVSPSPRILQEMIEKEPEIRGSLWVRRCGKALGNGSLWVFLHYVTSRIDKLLADAFFDSLATGTNMRETDPVYLLREQIIRANNAGKQMPPHDLCARVFKAWNATRTARPIKKIQAGHPRESESLPKPE